MAHSRRTKVLIPLLVCTIHGNSIYCAYTTIPRRLIARTVFVFCSQRFFVLFLSRMKIKRSVFNYSTLFFKFNRKKKSGAHMLTARSNLNTKILKVPSKTAFVCKQIDGPVNSDRSGSKKVESWSSISHKL